MAKYVPLYLPETPPSVWISAACISLVGFVLSMCLLGRERRNRQRRTIPFPSKYLSLFPYSSIALTPLATLSCVFYDLNGICLVARNVTPILCAVQYLLFSYFQLSRIYYCFSEKQVHSNKGYPKWVFSIMFIATTLYAVSWAVFQSLSIPFTQCGIRRIILLCV